MSVTGGIVTKVLAAIKLAIPSITTLEGTIGINEIPTGKFPHAQAFGEAMSVVRTLPWRIEEQAHAFTVVITDRDKTKEQMLTHFDSILTQLDLDRKLAFTVRWVKITGFGLDESADTHMHLKTLFFEVVAEVYR